MLLCNIVQLCDANTDASGGINDLYQMGACSIAHAHYVHIKPQFFCLLLTSHFSTAQNASSIAYFSRVQRCT